MPTGIYIRQPISETHRHNLSVAMKGKQNSLGYKHSEEWKQNKSEAMLGNHYALKGEIHIYGYVWIYLPGHPKGNMGCYVKQATLVLERKLGRPLLPQEIPHHINGIKDDDRPENLTAFPNGSEHKRFHSLRGDYFGGKEGNSRGGRNKNVRS